MDIHLVVISPDRERKAAFDCWVFRLVIRVLQRAAGQESFLALVESDCAELLPVVHEGLLGEYFV